MHKYCNDVNVIGYNKSWTLTGHEYSISWDLQVREKRGDI